VREALRILEKDSVVRILPNRGAHVTQLSIKEVGDIFEIRRDLVGAMVRRLAAARRLLARSMPRCASSRPGEEPGASEPISRQHRLGRLLADGCGNERLAEILGSLARQTRRYSKLGLATAARRKESARTGARWSTR
jgi:DNA-binding GntR family transcriptional regulator